MSTQVLFNCSTLSKITFHYDNSEQPHQTFGGATPDEAYQGIAAGIA